MADVDTYRCAVIACVAAQKVLQQFDIPGLLQDIERAHATGPILDPTLYRAKVGAMDEDAALLRASLPLRNFRAGKAECAACDVERSWSRGELLRTDDDQGEHRCGKAKAPRPLVTCEHCASPHQLNDDGARCRFPKLAEEPR